MLFLAELSRSYKFFFYSRHISKVSLLGEFNVSNIEESLKANFTNMN